MQPEGPYRFTETVGVCQVGRAWWAIDGQDRLVTVAVLEGAAADDRPWREAFTNAANALAQAPGGHPYLNADFAAARPWVAYGSEQDGAVQRLFQTLNMALEADSELAADGTAAQLPPTVGQPPTVPGPVPTSAVPASPAGPWAAGPVSGSLPAWARQAVATPAPHPVAVPESPLAPTQPAAGYDRAAPRIQPSAAAARGAGLWLAVSALVLGIIAAIGGVVVWTGGRGGTDPSAGVPAAFPTDAPAADRLRPWGQFAPSSPQERALAVAGPSLVFVEAVVTGYLRDRTTNTPVRTTPIVFNRRCSAFVVNPDGHALTSSSCVKPPEETARQIALDAVARMLVREKKLDAGAVKGYVAANLEKTRFTGIDPDTEPSTQLFGQLNAAKGNVSGDQAIPGELVKAQAPDTGNVALVKLGRENLPAAELNTGAAVSETGSLLVVGFATDDTEFRTATYTPLAKAVPIAGTGRRGGVSTWRIGDDLGGASHGGIAIDPSGRVIGMLDQDLARPDRASRVVVPASAFTDLLSSAGVTGELGGPDKLYRSGLDAYFTGRYPTAITQLGTVVERSPGNLLAQAYRQNATDRQQLEGAPTSAPAWAWWLLAGAGGALLILLAMLVATLVRRRA